MDIYRISAITPVTRLYNLKAKKQNANSKNSDKKDREFEDTMKKVVKKTP